MPDKLYLAVADIAKKRGQHTHFMGTGAIRTGDKLPQMHSITFIDGVAHDVPDELARQAIDEGIATRTRPKRREDD